MTRLSPSTAAAHVDRAAGAAAAAAAATIIGLGRFYPPRRAHVLKFCAADLASVAPVATVATA